MSRTDRPRVDEQARLFDYDADVPLNVDVGHATETGGASVVDISYDDSTGQRVPAYVVSAPARNGCGLIIAHGGTADGRHFFVDEAVALSHLGFTVLLPATTLPRHGNIAASTSAIRASVLVHRRGLDVLTQAWSVDADRLGFYGHSGGACQAAILSAVEPRLSHLVIASIGSGTIVRLARAELDDGDVASAPAYLNFLERFDPVHFVAVKGDRRLLFQHGTQDQTVTRAEAQRLYAAAAPPRQWLGYPCGHATPAHPEAYRDRVRFLSDLLR